MARLSLILFAFFLLPLSLFLVFFWFSGWNGRDPVNAVISSGENLWVLSLRPGEKQAVEVLIPPTAIIEVPGRGKWQARALWEVSRLEKDPSLVAAAGWNLLQVPVDFSLRFSDWQSARTSYAHIFTSGRNDALQKFRIIKFLRSLNQSQIKQIDLSALNISRRVVDPGGAELVEINPDLLSPFVAQWFKLDALRQEGLTIAIRNNSNRSGAAALLSGRLEHVGLRVVSVADGGGDNPLTVKAKDDKKTLSVRKLSAWLDAKPAVADFPERADILIVVK